MMKSFILIPCFGSWKTVVVIGVITVLLILTAKLTEGGKHKSCRKKARKIHQLFLSGKLSGGRGLAYLRKIEPFVFEELVLDGFEYNGYVAVRNKRYTGDGGIDGKVRRDGKEYLIQCKRYKSYINPGHVDDFVRLCKSQGMRGFFVHAGKTGGKSREIIYNNCSVTIISGEKLLSLLSKNK